MNDNQAIYIPQQFDRATEPGYLSRHAELTGKFEGLFERDDSNASSHIDTAQERRKNELFHQACEDVARQILLSEAPITSIAVSDAQAMVEARYNQFLENPKLAGVSRAAAVH